MNAQMVNSHGLAGGTGAVRKVEGTIGRLVSSMAEWLEERRRYRSTVVELERLTDRELADVGLERSDIERIARSCCGR
ncbi:MAG TPA: DUF1127 domain-containing protein [Geminicoccaceae bacterium]|nr:DUF1127 domain-containing protein [Geminicoccaceae bacterium]